MKFNFRTRLIAEFIGTAFLLAAVVGSGIMAERLAAGNTAIALLANSIATGAALVALILAFSGISGAHFNPGVTLAELLRGALPRGEALGYVVAQISGAYLGVVCAHLMFALPAFSHSHHLRGGAGQILSEFIATFGLMIVVFGCSRLPSSATSIAVGAYITAAYWFTASTSFANPAVTLARAATDTFTGIRPKDVPPFITAQIIGAAAAWLVWARFIPITPVAAREGDASHSGDHPTTKGQYSPHTVP